jgi:hypothetical protein
VLVTLLSLVNECSIRHLAVVLACRIDSVLFVLKYGFEAGVLHVGLDGALILGTLVLLGYQQFKLSCFGLIDFLLVLSLFLLLLFLLFLLLFFFAFALV